jgi:WD40 repeat protein
MSLDLTPDVIRIPSAGSDGTVQVWDATNGIHVFTHRVNAVPSGECGIAWSADSKRIASAGDIDSSGRIRTVQIWDAANGGHVFTYRGHTYEVNAIAWSPNGTRIASGGVEMGSDGLNGDLTVHVWDAANGGNVYIYGGHAHEYTSVEVVVWSPHGTGIASSSDQTVQVWNAADGSHVHTYRGHTYGARALAWSPDGMRIASGGVDKTVQVWRWR